MRAITKGPEPTALRDYRAVPGATYDGKDFTPVKDEVRKALLQDQLWLCCYCMRRISKDTRPHPTKPDSPPIVQMKVEHWQSQEHFPTLQLAWGNLLGACLGGEGTPKNDQTCDTRKGEDPIASNPLDPAHVATLSCRTDGRLESTDPRFQEDLDRRLGLNHAILLAERKSLLDRALHRLRARHKGTFTQAAVRALADEMEAPVDGKLPALATVLRLWARRRFRSKT